MNRIKNISIAVVLVCMLAIGASTPSAVHAQAFDSGCCDSSYSWGSDSSYNLNGSDTSYNWGNDNSYNWGGDSSYNWGNDNSYNLSGSDSSYNWGSSDSNYNWGSDSSYNWAGSDSSYNWGTDYAYTYEPTATDYAYTYEPLTRDYAYTYEPTDNGRFYPASQFYPASLVGGSYGSSYGGSSYTPTYTSSGYSTVRPMTFSLPGYSSYTPSYSAPVRPTTGGSSSNITNTTITNVDNSINDSFNNYNSNNVSYVAPATPQYPVVYTQPAPYCTIYQSSAASGYGVNATHLTWTSSNATSAYLSNVGSVNLNGSQTVWPTGSSVYTLTVYGYNGQQATCQTTVNAYATPYVSLTQIPYTGFDFGTVGNAIYWAALMLFAAGAGYLAVYYIPALAFAGARSKTYAPIVPAKAPILVEREAAATRVAPIVNSIKKAGTIDTMAIVDRKDGSMPKIVISRE